MNILWADKGARTENTDLSGIMRLRIFPEVTVNGPEIARTPRCLHGLIYLSVIILLV